MKTNQIKLLATVVFIVLTAVMIGFNANETGAILAADDDAATIYKTKCAACHSPKAEKHFDLAKTDEQHVAIVLNGKKDAKPPMPEYASKGITPEKAKALVVYMRQLRTPESANANTANANVKSNINTTNANANANTNGNTDSNTTINKVPNEELAAIYKSKCAACHGQKAEKSYDPAMPIAEQAAAILKGKKAAKPPNMPAYEDKGTSAEQAKALAEFMKALRESGK